MPTNDIQWLWFAFYTGGATAGWLSLVLMLIRRLR
jgi:hypothetical protein